MRIPIALAVVLAALCAAPAVKAQGVPGFEAKPGTILEKFGMLMSSQQAMERVSFRPFVPAPNYTEVALLPAFHGDDNDHPENRGVGYEYVSGGISYMLREWPRAGGSLAKYPAFKGPKQCPASYFTYGTPRYPRAVAWETNALVYSLQPDIEPGANPNMSALRAEWARLARRGACR